MFEARSKAPNILNVFLIVVFFGTALAPPASARSSRAVVRNMSDQLFLVQKITHEALQVALGIDSENSVEQLRASQEGFDRILKGLRDGDKELRLRKVSNSEVLARLDAVEHLWTLVKPELVKIIETGKIDEAGVKKVAQLDTQLHKAIEMMTSTYLHVTEGLEVASLHLNTKEVARRQPRLLQKMFKEFLLIAYGHEVPDNQRNMTSSYSRFDRSLQALIHGDSELQLIPAPSPSIEAQLNRAQQIWNEIKPIIKKVARNGKIDQEQIALVTSENPPLIDAIDQAVAMY